MSLNESIVEEAALEWFGELGYAVGHGPEMAPGEPASERNRSAAQMDEVNSFAEEMLVGRLREAIRRLNSAIPEEMPACASTRADRRATGKRYLHVQIERRTNP